MRLFLNKKILLIVLFFLFFVVIDNKCFAWTDNEIDEFTSSYGCTTNMSSELKEYFKSFTYHAVYKYQAGGNYHIYFLLTDYNIISYYYSSYNTYYLYANISPTVWVQYIYFYVSTSGNYPSWTSTIGSSPTNVSDTHFEFTTSNLNTVNDFFNNKIVYTECDLVLIKNNNTTTVVEGTPRPPSIIYETPTLYIDDMNFKKRFKFSFNIPMVRDDTKYYVFLQDYNRISYSSVSAAFRIFTVTTPEGYDYTDYENYMYYDNLEKKLYLPAGCEIKEYSCSGTNNSIFDLTLEDDFFASRNIQNNNFSTDIWFAIKNEENISWANLVTAQYLVPTNSSFNHFSMSYFVYNNLATGAIDNIARFLKVSNIDDVFSFSKMFYKLCLHTLYYSSSNSLSFDNFCFSNNSIISYENKKDVSDVHGTYYNLFRKTNVYNIENMINSLTFSFQYTDAEDVSSMLPSGTSVEYLTSPFYKDNENSSSGGYITYDINEILQGNKIIDYSKEDNSIHNNFNGDYIENYTEGDNIVINNYYTTTIDKTSDEHLLHNIYLAILEIKTKLSDLGDNISNTTNNFSYNTENTVKYYFVPNSYAMDNIKEEITDTAEDHLGIIYQPFLRNSIYIWCCIWSCY